MIKTCANHYVYSFDDMGGYRFSDKNVNTGKEHWTPSQEIKFKSQPA